MEETINVFSNDALGKMDAVGIAAAIKDKKISVAEVTEAAIARAEIANSKLDAIVLKTYDDARNNNTINKDGLLYGVPTFIKDNENIKGYPTQKGTGTFKARIEKKNSKYVNQFLSTGLNNLGKSTLPEFGFICSTENEKWNITRNPWNTEYTTGGSSSGSSALVACGAVPIAVANDGAGSTRIPASCCGLVGLKPTRGRLQAMHGTETLPVNIVYSGVVTRTVRDTAAFYAAAEQFKYNSKLPKIGHVQSPLNRKLKVVLFENTPVGARGHMSDEVYAVQLESAKLLESLGHKIELIKMPLDIESLTAHYLNYYGFLSYMTTTFGSLVLGAKVDKSMLEPFTIGLKNIFAKQKLKLPKSLQILKKAARETEQDMFSKYDLIMTPVTTIATPKIGYFSPTLSFEEIVDRATNFATYLPLFNVSGSPAISLPLGESANKMPLGVQLVAPYGQDKLLLETALQLEQAKPWKFIYDK